MCGGAAKKREGPPVKRLTPLTLEPYARLHLTPLTPLMPALTPLRISEASHLNISGISLLWGEPRKKRERSRKIRLGCALRPLHTSCTARPYAPCAPHAPYAPEASHLNISYHRFEYDV